MGHKSLADRQRYFEVLRRMTPEQRLKKAIELSELGKQLFLKGLRKRFPHMDDHEIHMEYLKRKAKCHNRNY